MWKREVLAMLLLSGLAGCAGYGFGGGGYPWGYGYPGPYGYYPGAYGGYGYYPPPRPYYPRYTAPPMPPMSPEQRQLKYLYDHREKISRLPPKQQKQIARRARKLLNAH